jgi:hypothetical protein
LLVASGQLCQAGWQTVAAASLVAKRAHSLLMHLAVRAHLAHLHPAAGSAGRLVRLSHVARCAGKRRLSRQERDQGKSSELEKPLHPFHREYDRRMDRSVSQITNTI